MDILIRVVQLILILSILIFVHESGHFLFARLFKIKVEKFYLFFDPKFALFRYKPKNSDTEYGIGWIPLGGYCKIAGMVDESMDKESMKKPPQPWEFRSKPAWQRLLVLFGGVLFNFILAIIVYGCTLYTWGESYIRNEDAVYGIYAGRLAQETGFRHGDKIIAFDGVPTTDFAQLQIDMVRSQAETATVIRDDDTITIKIDQSLLPQMLNTPNMFSLSIPFQIYSVPDTSVNIAAGLMRGDILEQVDSLKLKGGLFEAKSYFASVKGQNVDAVFRRGQDTLHKTLQINPEGYAEVIPNGAIADFIQITEKDYSLMQCMGAGARKAATTLSNYLQELKLVANPETEAYKSVGSFIRIGQILPPMWNWMAFWNILAFLSVMLAVLNVLPIPALDGGHIVFTLFEMITGKKPRDKVLEVAQIIGMAILLGIMVLAFSNDIIMLFNS